MPVISCDVEALWGKLGVRMTQEDFEQLCFDFGIELDDVLYENGPDHPPTYKIEIPANRYDLLCIEGLTRALRIFLGKEASPTYRTVGTPSLVMRATAATRSVRPIVVCAVLRNVTFTESSYKSFIDLQDKLHHNICRRRTLVSIGTHDLDTIEGPFLYDARSPKDIRFAPLNKKVEVDAVKLFDDIRANEPHLKPYLSIIEESDLYPVIYDNRGVVLSLPPIINGDVSKITLNTRNVFIEVTATDHTKAEIVLNTVVAMFSQYCAEAFTCEQVEVQGPDGEAHLYPNLEPRVCSCDVDYINSLLGLHLETPAIVSLLDRMGLRTTPDAANKSLTVSVPPTRSDVLHACDVVEDVGIAYGFNNLPSDPPATVSLGKQNDLNRLTDKLRLELALAGFLEVLTLSLCSREENFAHINRTDDGSAVVIANPKTSEFQVGRTNLLVGVLKTLTHNRNQPLPLKLFEVSDVMHVDPKNDVGASNQRRLCAVFYGKRSGFEDIHGLIDRLMLVLAARPTHVPNAPAPSARFQEHTYSVTPSDDPTYLPGRCADIILSGQKVGTFGILHPKVLANFSLTNVASAVEMTIEPFL
jgi:phenylalanyl-tRNA synthetase beta chain